MVKKRTSKEPRRIGRKEPYEDRHPVFSFQYYNFDTKYYSKEMAGEDDKKERKMLWLFLKATAYFSKLTWREIAERKNIYSFKNDDKSPLDHGFKIDGKSKNELQQTELYHFGFSLKELIEGDETQDGGRFFGYFCPIKGDVFYILLYDREHRIYPHLAQTVSRNGTAK